MLDKATASKLRELKLSHSLTIASAVVEAVLSGRFSARVYRVFLSTKTRMQPVPVFPRIVSASQWPTSLRSFAALHRSDK
ncbi:MAG: hypothetical protein GXY61_04785 [Lentisphaerae bacterium]|nr:hypothetical protein [Lentisphaerota bacterium]